MIPVSKKPEPLRILHLEDDALDAELIQREIHRAGIPHSITRIASLEELQAMLQERSFDVILSDSNLPGFDSLVALAFTVGSHPDIPFVVVSGNMAPKSKDKALALGAFDYTSKDDLSGMIRALGRVWADRAARQQNQEPGSGN